jgi:hypothetical protein
MISNRPQSLHYVPLDSQHELACERIPVKKAVERGYLAGKMKWIEQQQNNEGIRPCCRNPVEHADIEAWYSTPADKAKGIPDVYKIICRECTTDGLPTTHVKWCVGGNHPLAKRHTVQDRPELFDRRPFWKVR